MSHDHAAHIMMNGTTDHASHSPHITHMDMEHASMNHGSMDHTSMSHGSMNHGSNDVGASTNNVCSSMGMHGMSVGMSRSFNTWCC